MTSFVIKTRENDVVGIETFDPVTLLLILQRHTGVRFVRKRSMLTVKQLKQRKVFEVTLSESRFYKKWQTSAVIWEISGLSDSPLRRSYLHLKFVFPQVMSSPFHIMLMFNKLLSIKYLLPIDKKFIGTQSKVLSTTYVNFVLIPLTIKEDTTHLTLSPLNPKIFKKIIWALKGDWNSFDIRLHLRGGSRGRVQGLRTPPSPPAEMTCGFLIQLVFCQKKLCGLLVLKQSKRRVHPLLKKILDPPLHLCSCQKVGAVGDSSTRHFNQRTKAAFRTERKEAKTIAVILRAAIVCRLPLLLFLGQFPIMFFQIHTLTV